MDPVTPNAFWATMSIAAAAIGSSFFLTISHAGEPKNSESASESDVSEIQVRVAKVVTDVEYNKVLLGDLKSEIRELRTEQNESSREILEAIRNGN